MCSTSQYSPQSPPVSSAASVSVRARQPQSDRCGWPVEARASAAISPVVGVVFSHALSDQRFEELKALATTANQCALAAGLDDFNLNKFARERLAAQEVAADG